MRRLLSYKSLLISIPFKITNVPKHILTTKILNMGSYFFFSENRKKNKLIESILKKARGLQVIDFILQL